ncbi:PROTEIN DETOXIFICATION [Salix koriyanagi]|uniref:PROTEIN DETOXIFICATION n=2 Tax=Salix TaxID=40685 RepID=A0A9Q0WD42_9ROSI|nr:PROTEIN DETOXIFICATION [Salix koriyanagi]
MEREEQSLSLSTPLCEGNGVGVDEKGSQERGISKKEILEEVKKQLWLSGPLISVSLLQYCIQMISVMFVGHLGELSLAGASMATSFASVTGFSLLMGMASALDTFCGQSYGARQFHMLGIHMQRAMFVLSLVSIPLAIIWANTRSILIACGQQKDIAEEAGLLEMWSFESMVLLSGLLPDPELETSVLSISLNTAATVWMIPYGLSGAASTRVSNELGAQRPYLARLAVWVVIAIAVTEGIVVGIVLILIRNVWGYAYSNEIQVVNYVAVMLPVVATSNFLDGLQCVLSGVARGCGWQKIGAYINLGSYYLVGIPIAILLAFVFHVGGKGLWLGIICALVVQVLSLATITVRTNWEQEAKKATDRVYDEVIPVDTVS